MGERRGYAVHLIACGAQPEYAVAFAAWEENFGITKGLAEAAGLPS